MSKKDSEYMEENISRQEAADSCDCGPGRQEHREHEHHHHQEHGDSCGHEHHEHSGHDEHGHHDHHEHSDGCGCGHHHHEHGDGCSCGHEHHEHSGHDEHGHHHHELPPQREETAALAAMQKKVYTLENLGCANCAAKMEARIRELPGVEDAILTYATKQLKLYTKENTKDYLNDIQAICSSIEEEVTVTERTSRPRYQNPSAVKENGLSEARKDLIAIAAGAVLFAAGILTEKNGLALPSSVIFVAAYLLLGIQIVWTAVKNLTKGHVFDENFLMALATIAAFCIGDFAEAVGVMLFYRVGEYFEERAVEKSRNQIMSAVDMRPEVVHVIHGSAVDTVPAEDAVLDDILLIRPGDRIPLDGVVIEGESRIDTSPVTGEPVPVKAAPGSRLLSGCVNTSGLLKMRVEKTLEESMVTKILDSVENAASKKPVIDRFITKFARIYTPVVVLLALATAIIPSVFTGDWHHWIYTAITFLVISCPCALVLSVPLAFFSGIGAGSKKGILFKGGVSLEAISGVKAVVMDKTGTITKGNFVLQKALPADGFTPEQLLSYAASCEESSTHPIAQSILVAAKEQELFYETSDSVEEISGKGIRAVTSTGTLLCGNRRLMEAYSVALPSHQRAGSGTEVFLAKDGVYAGCLVISDTLKPDARASILALKERNLKTVMLTGDSEESARAIAEEIGIDEVHARLLPGDKLAKLTDIRSRLGAVMFIGDGINDAPVLAGADAGAAMGSGADAAIEAADIVFMNSNMSAVPEAIQVARVTRRISWQNVVFALAVKFLVMVLGLAGYASMWLAVFADTGVAMLCVLNSIRILYKSK